MFSPYGASGSIVQTPPNVRVTKAWQGSRSRRFSNVEIRDREGNLVAIVESSPAVKLAKKLGVKSNPKPTIATPSAEELARIEREVALEARRIAWQKSLMSVHIDDN
jgi:hypothetical protein